MSPYEKGSKEWLIQNPDHAIEHLYKAAYPDIRHKTSCSEDFMNAIRDIAKAYKIKLE